MTSEPSRGKDSENVVSILTQMDQRLDAIDQQTDSMDRTLELLLETQGKKLASDLLAYLESDIIAAKIFLAVDPSKTQRDIFIELISSGINTTEKTVSIKIQELKQRALIDTINSSGRGKRYRKSKLDRIFNLSKKLKERLESGK